jgi:hypothetical protein
MHYSIQPLQYKFCMSIYPADACTAFTEGVVTPQVYAFESVRAAGHSPHLITGNFVIQPTNMTQSLRLPLRRDLPVRMFDSPGHLMENHFIRH